MKKTNSKTIIVIIVLLIALICAIVVLSVKSKDNNKTKKVVQEELSNVQRSADAEKAKKTDSDEKQANNKNTGPDPMEKKHGKKKDIGGGLYEYEDGTIETEILP